MAGWLNRRDVLRLGVVVAAGAAGAAVAVALRDGGDDPVPDGTKVKVGDIDVFVVDRSPTGPSVGSVLFLHGSSYTSSVWDRTGLLDDVTEAGWRAVAIDLPGHGQTRRSAIPPARFIEQLMSVVVSNPVIVSPSASGRYSLPVVARTPHLLRGFVPVAPVGLDDFEMARGETPPPSLVVWGTDDDVVDVDLEPPFVEALGGEAAPVPGAGHAPYEDHTPEFRRLLLGFLRTLQ